MRTYKTVRSLETTPKVWGLRTPMYLIGFGMVAVLGVVAIFMLKSLVGALVVIAVVGGAFYWFRVLSDDSNMNIRSNAQPERIEGYRETDI